MTLKQLMILIVVVTIFGFSAALAQVQITADEYPINLGEIVNEYEAVDEGETGLSVDVGMSGGPQEWRLKTPAFPEGNYTAFEIVDFESTPFVESVESSNLVHYTVNEDSALIYTYYNLSDSVLEMTGVGSIHDNYEEFVGAVPAKRILKFPIGIDSTWNTTYAEVIPLFDSSYVVQKHYAVNNVDAYGTMFIHENSYTCLRINMKDSMIVEVYNGGQLIQSETIVAHNYYWIGENTGFIASVEGVFEDTPNRAYKVKFKVTDPTGMNEVQPSAASQFKLNGNYPNPFNPSTVISFQLPETSNITLEIFNITGQHIQTLVSGRVTKGYHEVNFNGQNLPSGIYFYRLSGNNVNITKRMVLMK